MSVNPFMSAEGPHLTEFEVSAQPLFHDSNQLSFGLQGSSVGEEIEECITKWALESHYKF